MSVQSIFTNAGMGSPRAQAVWEAIDLAESGNNPNAQNGNAVGLFQLMRGSGQGGSYSVSQLKNPTINAQIAAPYIANAYKQGRAYGFSGPALASYTALHSGHPITLMPGSMSLAGQPSFIADQAAVESRNVANYYTKLRQNPSMFPSSTNSSNATGSAGILQGLKGSGPGLATTGFLRQYDSLLNPAKYGIGTGLFGLAGDMQELFGRGVTVVLGLGIAFIGVYSIMHENIMTIAKDIPL